jgi:hypothetical protein
MFMSDVTAEIPKNSSAQSYKAPLKTDAAATTSFGGLTRSHSSPNIAKMVQDADATHMTIPVQSRTQPVPDRATKPQSKYDAISAVRFFKYET